MLVISGKMSYHANIAMVQFFIDHILPAIKSKVPDVKLFIVGKDPPKDFKQLGGKNGITVTGTVKDIRPYLRRASVAIAPLRYGAGIQNKVLEAMACGAPVITTSQAASALFAENGKDFVVEDSPLQFAETTVQLLNNSELSRKIGRSGRRYVETYHDWSTIACRLTEIYDETIRANYGIRT